MPFCRTATRVCGAHSRFNHGALDGVSCALVHNSTQSTGLAWSAIGEGAQRHLDRAFRPFDREVIDRPPHAGRDIVPVGRAQQACDDAADAAEADRRRWFCDPEVSVMEPR